MTREELLKVAKPILFSTEMVRAILEGRKTMTRRVITLDLGLADTDKNDKNFLMIPDEYGDFHSAVDLCRYKIGDYLYVRETFCPIKIKKPTMAIPEDFKKIEYIYKADNNHIKLDNLLGGKSFFKWKPSRYMPKAVARIFLRVTDVGVERLQDITEEEAKKEGCFTFEEKISNENLKNSTTFDLTAKDAFKDLWNNLNKKRGYGWEANPWVWVIEFERVKVK